MLIETEKSRPTFVERLDKLSPYPRLYEFVMSENEIVIFEAAIKEAKHYLEFGMGGSTLRAIQKSKASIYTVESSPEWLDCMRQYMVIRFHENRRLKIFPVNIGPTGAWGFPKSEEPQDIFEVYSSHIFKSIDQTLIDLALIDGRFRVACTLKLIIECHRNSDLKILIHDFWNRDEYHILLKYLDTIEKADTIGLFSIKQGIDLEAVKTDYETYKFTTM